MDSKPVLNQEDQKWKQQSQVKTINIVQQTQKLYQDLSYITGIAIETQAALNQFKNEPDHPMVNIQLNRMITQANLSNGIAFAMAQEAKDDTIDEQLAAEKEQVKKYFEELIKEKNFDNRIKALLDEYEKNNLSKNPYIHQNPILPIVQNNIKISQEVLQKVVDGMGQQDQIADRISKDPTSYVRPTLEEIKQINIQRQHNAYQKLFVNFTMIDINNKLLNICSKFEDRNKTLNIFTQYLQNLDNHFKEFENVELYNKIFTDVNIHSWQNDLFKDILRLLIAEDIGTLDTYFCQTIKYLNEQKIPERITTHYDKSDFR